jgi:inhibitor of cysteine peptidase
MRLGPRGRHCRCREGLTMLSLIETDNDRTVEVRLGDVVRITLPENASTGFRWTIDRYNEDIIEALGSEPRYTAGDVGSGGEILFTFKAKKAGRGEIALKHWRHWEGDRSVIGRFRVRLNV